VVGGRSAGGKFAAGNPGGPGRPRRAAERDYLLALTEAVSVDDWRAVVAKALDQAKAGDKSARQWLSDYLIGESDPEGLQTRIEELEQRLGLA
jgi:hypothetical protein